MFIPYYVSMIFRYSYKWQTPIFKYLKQSGRKENYIFMCPEFTESSEFTLSHLRFKISS